MSTDLLISNQQKEMCRKTFEVLSILNAEDKVSQLVAVNALKLLVVIEEYQSRVETLRNDIYQRDIVIKDKNQRIKYKNRQIEELKMRLQQKGVNRIDVEDIIPESE